MSNTLHVFEKALAQSSAADEPLPTALVAKPSTIARVVKPRSKSSVPFIKGPIPLGWMMAAAKCSRAASMLATALWYRIGLMTKQGNEGAEKTRKLVIRIDRQLRNQCGLKRWHVGKGIRDLAHLGLIVPLKAGRGRCPEVEVLREAGKNLS
jgi:hypothetical protein